MWPGKGKSVLRDDVLGDGVGDDGGGLAAHHGRRRRLDRMNDAGGVGGIRLAGARAHGERAVQHGQRGAECIRRLAGRIDDGERYGKSEQARALGEGILVGEDDERGRGPCRCARARPAA